MTHPRNPLGIGGFQPGQSGNPSGRPRDDNPLKKLAKEKTEEAFNKVVQLMQSDDLKIQLDAAKLMFEYGWGKPKQELELSGDKDAPLQAVLVKRLERQES